MIDTESYVGPFEFDSESIPNSYLTDWDSDESAENRRRPNRRRPAPTRPAPNRSLFQPRPSPGASSGSVTQAQLEAALAKVREQINANATAIKQVDTRTATVISDMQKLQASTKKDLDKVRSDLRMTQLLSAMVPIVSRGNPDIEKVAPLIHLVGTDALGGSSSGGSGSGGLLGGNNNLILIGALAYASGMFKPAGAP